MVQLPEGSPVNSTLPLVRLQVGCVRAPTVGAGRAPKTVIVSWIELAGLPETPPRLEVIITVT